jgi:hypothetical protein
VPPDDLIALLKPSVEEGVPEVEAYGHAELKELIGEEDYSTFLFRLSEITPVDASSTEPSA